MVFRPFGTVATSSYLPSLVLHLVKGDILSIMKILVPWKANGEQPQPSELSFNLTLNDQPHKNSFRELVARDLSFFCCFVIYRGDPPPRSLLIASNVYVNWQVKIKKSP